jgi:CTP synthase
MRRHTANSTRGSRVAKIYDKTEISERHRHRYEVNTNYVARLEQRGCALWNVARWNLPEVIEYEDHPGSSAVPSRAEIAAV